jgi:Ca-activated chloride channel family protein
MGRAAAPLGDVVKITGQYQGNPLGIEFEQLEGPHASAGSTTHDFIPQLWATRKVGYLLDQIRAHGESRELKDEVIRLATDYGLVTPFTSYLAVDDAELDGQPPGIAHSVYDFDDVLIDGHFVGPRNQRRLEAEKALIAPGNFGAASGKGAVDVSKATADMKRADNRAQSGAVRTRHVGGNLFVFKDGFWHESGAKGKKTRRVKKFSKEWFDLADEPANRRKMAVGSSVVFDFEGETILVE